MKVKMTVFELNQIVHKAVTYARLKMFHGSLVETIKTGLFSSSHAMKPYIDDWTYWNECMSKVYPFTDMVGIFTILSLDPSKELWIESEALAKMMAWKNAYDREYKDEH